MPRIKNVGKHRILFCFVFILFLVIVFSAEFSSATPRDSPRVSALEENGRIIKNTIVNNDGVSVSMANHSELRESHGTKNVFEEPDEVLFAPRKILLKALAKDREVLTRRRPSLRPCTDDFNYSFIAQPEYLGSRSSPCVNCLHNTHAQNIVDVGMYSSPVKFLSPWKGKGIILPVVRQWKYSRPKCFAAPSKNRDDLAIRTSEEKNEMHPFSLNGKVFHEIVDPLNAIRANLPSSFCLRSGSCRITDFNLSSVTSAVASKRVADSSIVCSLNEDNVLPLPFFFRSYTLSHRLKSSSAALSSSVGIQEADRDEERTTLIVHKSALQRGVFSKSSILRNSSGLETQRSSVDSMKERIAKENENTAPLSQKNLSASIFEKKWPHLVAVDEYAYDEIHLHLSSELYTEYLILFYDEWNANVENLLDAVEDFAERLDWMENSSSESLTTASKVLFSPLLKKNKRQLLHPSASPSEFITPLKLGAFAALWQQYVETQPGEGQHCTTSSSVVGEFVNGTLATDSPPSPQQKPLCSLKTNSTPWDRVAIPPLPILRSMYSFSSSDQVPFQNVLQMVLAGPLHLFSSASTLQREIRAHPQSPYIFFVEEVPNEMTLEGFSPDSPEKDVKNGRKHSNREEDGTVPSKSSRTSVYTPMRYTNALRRFSDSCSTSAGEHLPTWGRSKNDRCRHSFAPTGTEQLDRFILRHSRSSLFVQSEFVVMRKLLMDYPVVAILTPPSFSCVPDSSRASQKDRMRFSPSHPSASSLKHSVPSFILSWNEESFYSHLRKLRKVLPTFVFVPNASTSCSHLPIWLSRTPLSRDADPILTTTTTADRNTWKAPFMDDEDVIIAPFQPTIDLRQFDAVLPHHQAKVSLSTLAASADREESTKSDWTLTVLSRVTPVMESSNRETATSLFPKRCFDFTSANASSSPDASFPALKPPSSSRRSSKCYSFIKQDIIFPSFLDGASSHSLSGSCLRVHPASRPTMSSLQPFLTTLVDVLQDTVAQWPVREVSGDSFDELLHSIFYPVHEPFALLSPSNIRDNMENNNQILNRRSRTRQDWRGTMSSFSHASRTNSKTSFHASGTHNFLFPQLHDSHTEEVIIVLHSSVSSVDASIKMVHHQEAGGVRPVKDRKEEEEEKLDLDTERSKQRKYCSWAIRYIAAAELHQGRNLHRRFVYVDDDAEELHAALQHAADQGSTSSFFCTPDSRPAALPSFCRVYCITREEKLVKLERKKDLFVVEDRKSIPKVSGTPNSILTTGLTPEKEEDAPIHPEKSTLGTKETVSLSFSTSASSSTHMLPPLLLPSPEKLKVALIELENRFTTSVRDNVPCRVLRSSTKYYKDSISMLDRRSCLYKHISTTEKQEKQLLVGNKQGAERWEKQQRKEARSLLHREAIAPQSGNSTLRQSSPLPAPWFLWIPEGKVTPVVMYELAPSFISTWTASPPTTQRREFIQNGRESSSTTTLGPSLQVVFLYDSSCGLSSNYLKALKLIASCYPSSLSSSAFSSPHDAGYPSSMKDGKREAHEASLMRHFFFLDLRELGHYPTWNKGFNTLFRTHSGEQVKNREKEKEKDVVLEGINVIRKLLLPSFFEDASRLYSPLLLLINRTKVMATLPTVSYIEEDRWLESVLDLILLMEPENSEYSMSERRNRELYRTNAVHPSLAVSSPYKEHIRNRTWECLDRTFEAEKLRRRPYREALHQYLKNGKQRKPVMENISRA